MRICLKSRHDYIYYIWLLKKELTNASWFLWLDFLLFLHTTTYKRGEKLIHALFSMQEGLMLIREP